jgi:maltose alpha-D-glucosyltransferase / alpha-amylase
MPTWSFPEKSLVWALHSGLQTLLPQFLMRQRWFGGKARTICSVEVSDIVPFLFSEFRSYFVLVRVDYTSGPAETYDIPLVQIPQTNISLTNMPLSQASGEIESLWLRIPPHVYGEEIILKDAVADQQFLTHLLDAIATGSSFPGIEGQIRAVSTAALPSLWQPLQGPLAASAMSAEQSNSSVVFEKRLVLKIFRRVEEGLNPDLEIGSFLTQQASFRNVPPLAGYLEYVNQEGARTSLGMMQGYVANRGDAWQFTLGALAGYYEKSAQMGALSASEIPHSTLLDLCTQAVPEEAARYIGSYLASAALLGQRTAELHLALASAQGDPDFAPEPFTEADYQSRVASAINLLNANFELLRRFRDGMPELVRHEADAVLKLEGNARRRFEVSARFKWSAMVTRIHGDYHLGQVLFTGSDFMIIDFEGEPARPLAERRKKRSPLQDVAGMLRSFHYAAYAPLLQQENVKGSPQAQLQSLEHWAQYWQKWVSAAFLKAYMEVSGNSTFIPKGREELALLLDVYLLDKAVYELGYELNNRPTWVRIPLDGISQLLQGS